MKRLIAYWLYKAFKIGEIENSKRTLERKVLALKQVATIQEGAIIHSAAVFNNQDDRSKICIGSHSVVQGDLLIFKHGGKISIGEYTFIGPGTRIWSSVNISIGNRVLISHNVNIHDNDSHPRDSKLRHEDFVHICSKGLQADVDIEEREIVIEDDAWIGFNAIILKGVRIGRGAIVGAGTIVTKDVPAYGVVVGGNQRLIKNERT